MSGKTEEKKSNSDEDIKGQVNQRFRTLPLISEYFPMTLKNGAIVPGVQGRCPTCNQNITKGLLRGEVRHVPEDILRVTAIGWCLNCDILFPYLFHIKPYGSDTFEISPLDERGWPELYEGTVVKLAKKRKRKDVVLVANSA